MSARSAYCVSERQDSLREAYRLCVDVLEWGRDILKQGQGEDVSPVLRRLASDAVEILSVDTFVLYRYLSGSSGNDLETVDEEVFLGFSERLQENAKETLVLLAATQPTQRPRDEAKVETLFRRLCMPQPPKLTRKVSKLACISPVSSLEAC